jgi:hypothetical protein
MNEKELIHELEQLKKEVAEIKAHRGFAGFLKRSFTGMNVAFGVGCTIVFTSIIIYASQTLFTDGDIISAGQVNANFTELYNKTYALETYANPAYDSGWVAADSTTTNTITLTHNLGYIPSKVTIYAAPDDDSTNVYLANYSSISNNSIGPESIWMSTTTISITLSSSDYLIFCDASHPCPAGVTSSKTGYMKVMLWK